MKRILVSLFVAVITQLYAQQINIEPNIDNLNEGLSAIPTDSIDDRISEKKITDKSIVFGRIYTGFYYGIKNNIEPRAAFGLSTGIIGLKHNFNDKIIGTIILDVTRTTHAISVSDSSNIPQNVSYFEGSKYTAFLKMAEIKWNINKNFALRFGQLLNTQYLTFQDKFWGYRYIAVTYQEMYRYGMPADFGAQFDYQIKGKLLNSISVVNGEGPFRYQDDNAKFLVSNNLQVYPIDGLTLKLYVDYQPPSDTTPGLKPRQVMSWFAGYKQDKYRIGAEYNYIFNATYAPGEDYSGVSLYSTYKFSSKWEVLARFDYIEKGLNINSGKYVIVGFQYKAWEILETSINYRYFMPGEIHQIYANFGLKF